MSNPLMPRKGFVSSLSTFICGTTLCATLLWTGCSPKLAPEAHYQETPVVADGVPNDWSLPLRFSNASYTMQYAITNDNKNIYVCIITKDEVTQLRILRSGMSLYFDPKGDKNKNISIVYPIRKQPDPTGYRSRNGNPITPTDVNSRKENLLLQSDFYNTTGLLNIENGQFAVADKKNGVRIAMKLNNDDSVLVYEAIVPIRDIVDADRNPKALQKNFSVGIVLNAIPGQGGNGGGGSRPYGGMRGGMGGMRGMGMGGGGGRGNYGSSGRTADVKEEADWFAFRLAGQTVGAKTKP